MENSNIQIVTYNKIYAEAFKDINVEWLESMFEVEPYDYEVLSNPQKYILDRSGNIWIALLDGEPMGTIALMELEPGKFELTKMGVLKKAQGYGAGKKLLNHLINNVFQTPEKTYFLLTNSNCKAAIHLYLKYGFVYSDEIQSTYGHHYKRCDVGMLYKP